MDEWQKFRSHKQYESIVASEGSNNTLQDNDLFIESLTGFILKGSNIHRSIDNKTYERIGKVVECKGFLEKCIVIDGYFKLMISKEFSFDSNKIISWEWEDYKYTINQKMEYSLLGNNLNVVEIIAVCKTCNFKLARFYYAERLGLIEFVLYSDTFILGYRLSDHVGFFSKPGRLG